MMRTFAHMLVMGTMALAACKDTYSYTGFTSYVCSFAFCAGIQDAYKTVLLHCFKWQLGSRVCCGIFKGLWRLERREMWLLLVAASTGYLARYWQKSGKFKTGPHIFKYDAALHSSQGSSPCTPRRGCSTTTGRRGPCKRSQSARGLSRKLLHGRKEGRLATTHARDFNENWRSSHNVCDESLCGKDFCGQCAFDRGTPGRVQTCSLLSCTHGKHHLELLLSSTTVCAQDLLRETCFGMEKRFLPTAEVDAKEQDRLLSCNCVLPIEKHSLNGGPTTRGENQLEGVTLSSRNCLDRSKPTENALLVSVSNRQSVLAVLACPDFLRVKAMGDPLKLKESTKQAFRFFAKLARGFGYRTCSKISNGMGRTPSLNTRNVPVFKYLSYAKPHNSIEKKKKQGFGPHFVHSQHLKPVFNPEIFDQSRRCTFLPLSSIAYDLQEAIAYSNDFTGLNMATNQRVTCVDKKLSDWDYSLAKALESVNPANLLATSKFEPSCAGEHHLESAYEVSFVALGLAMGALLAVTTSHNNELGDLHKLIKKNNTSIEVLRKQIDSRFELDSSKLPEVEKGPSGLTMTNETCSHPDISSCQSAGEKDCLELFSASDNHEANESFESQAHGFEDLQAELEAELELMELNGCNTDLADREWKWTQLDQKGWQPQGYENGYFDKPEGDDTSYADIDIHDSIAIQDAGQVYDSDFVVPPLELERRLWQVLEQRHQERICELENDLHATQEEVTAKEMEIQWWKDCVLLLMETSLGGMSESYA